MYVNLDKIIGKKVAVHTPGKDAVMAFCEAMKSRFPDKALRDLDICLGFVERYEREAGMCLNPRFTEPRSMTYGRRDTYESWGLDIIEFEELIVQDLEIKLSDMELDMLFN